MNICLNGIDWKSKMNCELVTNQIVTFIKDYANKNGIDSLVVGVSGGVDSGLVSTLCAKTRIKTYCVIMPCRSALDDIQRAKNHVNWLITNNPKIESIYYPLYNAFINFTDVSPMAFSDLAEANLKSRLRMCVLYTIANTVNGIVVGTGNKVEDYGVGFFTKFGDGGVDISPIGDLYKSEVRELAAYLGVNPEIVNAIPTDGLWEDGRVDEYQLGMSYEKLEEIMKLVNGLEHHYSTFSQFYLGEKNKEEFETYLNLHNKSRHKMGMPPICKLDKE